MDAERFQELMGARDVARDAFVKADSELRAAIAVEGGTKFSNGNDAPAPITANGKKTDELRTRVRDNIARVKRAYKKRESEKAGAPAVESTRKFPAPFRSATGPKILTMLKLKNRTFVELAAAFEKDMGSAGVHAALDNLSGLNFAGRDGDGYAIKAAGRAWLDNNGEGK